MKNRIELQINKLITEKGIACIGKYYGRRKDNKINVGICEITLMIRRDVVDFLGYFERHPYD